MKHLLALAAAIVIAACGPVYETQYDYIPPHDRGAQGCLAQCNANKSQCRSTQSTQAENERLRCELDAEQDYSHCQNRAVNGADRDKCTKRSCYTPSAESTQCDEDFRICFAGCGGTVESHQVCTFNCPQ